MVVGGRERADSGDPGNLQRAARLSRVLAHLQHHGRQPVQRPLQALHRRRRHHRQLQRGVVAQPVRGHVLPKLHLVQPEGQLRQRAQRIPLTPASGASRLLLKLYGISCHCRWPI